MPMPEKTARQRLHWRAVQRSNTARKLTRIRIVSAVASGDVWQGNAAIEAHKHCRICGQIHFLALARGNIDGANRETDAHTAPKVPRDQSNGRSGATAEGQTDCVTLVVVLLLDDLAFRDFDVLTDRTRA